MKDEIFYRIDNLEKYFEDGSGLAEQISEIDYHVKVYDKHGWKQLFSNL